MEATDKFVAADVCVVGAGVGVVRYRSEVVLVVVRKTLVLKLLVVVGSESNTIRREGVMTPICCSTHFSKGMSRINPPAMAAFEEEDNEILPTEGLCASTWMRYFQNKIDPIFRTSKR